MRVYASKTLPSAQELAEILKQEFSTHCSYELFGIGKEKSIIVQKSTFVGVQISKSDNELTIVEMCPFIASWLLSILTQCAANLFMLFFPAPYKKLEREVSSFLQQRYN